MDGITARTGGRERLLAAANAFLAEEPRCGELDGLPDSGEVPLGFVQGLIEEDGWERDCEVLLDLDRLALVTWITGLEPIVERFDDADELAAWLEEARFEDLFTC